MKQDEKPDNKDDIIDLIYSSEFWFFLTGHVAWLIITWRG